MAGIQTGKVIVSLFHFAEDLNNLYKFHSNKYKIEAITRAIAAVNMYWVHTVHRTVLNISYTFIQEKGINVIPFYPMRKVRHTANEWGKEDLNPGLNLKPMLLTTMCNENNKLSDILRKLKWKIDHKWLQRRGMWSRYPRGGYLTYFPIETLLYMTGRYTYSTNISVPPVNHGTSRNF